MTFQGYPRRLTPQRLILDLLDAFLLRRGMLPRPRPLGRVNVKLVERLGAAGGPGNGAPINPAVEPAMVRTPSGFLIFFDAVHDPTLGAKASGLAPGRYTVEVSGTAYQPRRVAVQIADAPPPYDDLPDDAGARTAVRLELEPSFVHPNLLRSTRTRIGGVVETPAPRELDGTTVAVSAGGAGLGTYTLDRRGQWLLLLDDAALDFNDRPPPQVSTAPVTVTFHRGGAQLGQRDVGVAAQRLTTVPTIALPGT